MKQSVAKKLVPVQSSLTPKPAKIMHETIQISLIRSMTSPETSGGDKTSTTTAATSGDKSSNQSESKESVKDSDTSYSSSDTDPVSLSENEGNESSVLGEEDSEYSEEYSETEPTEPTSYGAPSSCTQYHTHSTGMTGSEMPQTRGHTRSRALSIKSTPKSCDLPIKNITKHYSNYTSFGTTLTTNSGFYTGNTSSPNQNTSSQNRNKSSQNRNSSYSRNQSTTPTSSQQPERDSVTTPSVQFTQVLEPINENDYIRAKLTLPTNEVISILMKKDQKLIESFFTTTTPKQCVRNMNETGDSNDQAALWVQQNNSTSLQHDTDQSGDQEQGRSLSRLQTSCQQMLVDEYDKEKFRNRLANTPHPNNIANKEESHCDKQIMDSQHLTRTSQMNKATHVKGYKVGEYRIPIRSNYTLGLEDFKDLENHIEENPRPCLNMVKSKSEDGCKIPERVSFNLPSLPKLTTEKSVSFKINTEIIRDRKKYGRCHTPFYKRPRDKKLNDRRVNKKEKESHRLHKVSSTRCPKFIRFDQTDTPPEILERSKQSPIKMLSRHSICDVGKSLLCKIAKFPRGPGRSNQPVHESDVPCSCNAARKATILDSRKLSNSSTPDCSFQTLPRVCERRLSCKKSVNTVTGNMYRKGDPPYQMMNENDIQRQIQRVLSAKMSFNGLPQLHKNREIFSRQRKPAKQQKNVKDKQTVSDKINRHSYKCETISPQGITKNYVRFYESNFLPEPDSTKYNFQIIRNKFESRENSRQNPEKKMLVNKMPFNFAKLCKQFSSKRKLNKCECQVEEQGNGSFRNHLSKGDSKGIRKGSTEIENSAKETFNNLLKEIIETVEKKKSERCILMGRNNPKSDKETERNRNTNQIIKEIDSNRTDDSKSDLCSVWKFNNNTPELKQLELIFKTVKRAYNKNMKNKKKKMVHLQAKQDLSKDVHSSRIGKHLVQMYLKCFSKRDQTPYSQNDFINIRKVVNFFLKYLAFEYKYVHMYTNIDMTNIVYSVYAKISQRHFRLKNNFSASSESDPQHDPWPVIVYEQLTQFSVMTDIIGSHANCKESTTKLRPSLSLQSEHFTKYMAVDYFLKLLKIVVTTGRENVITKENNSCGTTASTFNSHLYCQLPSSSRTSSPCFPISHHAEEESKNIASHIMLSRAATQTDNESLSIATRVQSIKAKLKRFKKRKTRRCLIQKQLNRSLNTKLNKLKQDTDLSKFELNRFVLNKTVNGKHVTPYLNRSSRNKLKHEVIQDEKHANCKLKTIARQFSRKPISLSLSFILSSLSYGKNDHIPNGNSKEKQNKVDSTKVPDNSLENTSIENKPVILVHSAFQQPRQYNSQPPPPPPPPPQIGKEEIIENNNASKLINEVSNLVCKIAKYTKNVNVEKIKQQINFLLESNSSELDGTREEEVVEGNKKEESPNSGNLESGNQTVMKQDEPSKNVQKTNQSDSTSRNLMGIQTCLIEEMKQNMQEVETQANQEKRNKSNDSPVDRSSVFKDLKHREAMVPVNMAKTLVRDNTQRGRDNENLSIEKTGRDCYREQSELMRNQQLFNTGTRNKVISNKINQKIMELTKNMSIDITKTLQVKSQSPEKCTRVTEMNLEPCLIKLTKNKENKYAPNLSDLEESIKSSDKKCYPNETATKPSNAPPIKGNFISNDDLFFTNRRRPSVFNRPVLSVLELESDLLSDVRGSDDEFSIHEIYFKTPYYRHDSKSCTNQLDNDIVVCDFQQDVKPRPCLTNKSEYNTREKCLTKKQMEVFNKLRTMYQEDQDEASIVTNNKYALIDSRGHNNIVKADNRFDSMFRSMCRRSKSHSYIYGHENEMSNISMKTCRSSETVPEST